MVCLLSMGNDLNISLSLRRSTVWGLGMSAAAHAALLYALSSVVVHPGSRSLDAGSLLDLDLRTIARNTPEPTRTMPRPATPEELQKLIEQVPIRERPKTALDKEPETIKLGVDDGKKDTEAWLGFADESLHRAQKSAVEQSALTKQAGTPGKAAAKSSDNPTSELPDSENAPRPEGSPQPETSPRDEVQGSGAGASGSGPGVKDQEERQAREFRPRTEAAPGIAKPRISMLDPFAEALLFGHLGDRAGDAEKSLARQERVEAAKRTIAGTKAEKAAERVAQGERGSGKPASKPSVAPATSGDGNKPGIVDDAEAEATALADPVDVVVNGKVAAAKGLKIRTVAPEFATTTLLTARPRNPRVLITFSKSGKVSKAEFVPGMSTGFIDVDQPLLNAIYRWTAQGEPLAKLSAAGSRGELTIAVNVLFP